jgi:hypothetical protein
MTIGVLLKGQNRTRLQTKHEITDDDYWGLIGRTEQDTVTDKTRTRLQTKYSTENGR